MRNTKEIGMSNPLISNCFTADPTVISYQGVLYFYTTGDILEFDEDGIIKDNTYSKINTLNIFSTVDLINFTYNGTLEVSKIATWAKNSWAPAICVKKINGADKFFLYFANSGNGIGVLQADSPLGPFIDPLGKALIDRNTPKCSDIVWLFDPAVLVDDDEAYLYFGGGIPNKEYKNPKTARVVQLNDDMISLKTTPVVIEAPYFFEDAGINKIGDNYFYSYCTNWNIDEEGKEKYQINSAYIAYMESKNPLGPFTFVKTIYKNPGDYFKCYSNNHHTIFKHEEKYYIAYHTEVPAKNLSLGEAKGYRFVCLDEVSVSKEGYFQMGEYTKKGVTPIKNHNPYEKTSALTAGILYIDNVYFKLEEQHCIKHIKDSDWIVIYACDFKEGAYTFHASLKASPLSIITIKIDSLDSKPVGYLKVDKNQESKTILNEQIRGIHDLYIVFHGEFSDFNYWYFK